MVYLRMISDVQHDPDTVDNLVAAIRIEQATHIPVLARQAKFPLVELAIKLTIFLLPLFDVGESANIDLEYAVSSETTLSSHEVPYRLLQKSMNLRQNAKDLDVV